VCWFFVALVGLHLTAAVAMEVACPQVRDPEYGRRVDYLRQRVAEHPGRPLVVVVGSSRGCMAVKPDSWEAVRPGGARDPLLFNLSTVGAGPIQELLTVRRLNADGVRPAVVLVEYWPPLLRQDSDHGEADRIEARRLFLRDRPVIRDYFPDPASIEHRMWAARVDVFRENRDRLLVQTDPQWLVRPRRIDCPWAGLDDWGWLPAMDVPPGDTVIRSRFLEHFRPQYLERFTGYTIHPSSDRALREIVALVRAAGVQVGFIYLPESSEFRSWYPPEVEEAGRAYLADLSRELDVPVIDARTWMADGYLIDGFHLTRVGAAKFTERLGPAVVAAFPNLGGQP